MNVRDVIEWVRSLRAGTPIRSLNPEREYRERIGPVCAPECGPHWRGGFCDDDCPNAPGIARHSAEHLHDNPMEHLAHTFGDGPPIRITSMEQLREMFGEGSSIAEAIRARSAQLGRAAMEAAARAIMQNEAEAGTFDELEPPLEPDATGRVIRSAAAVESITIDGRRFAIDPDIAPTDEQRRAMLGRSAMPDGSYHVNADNPTGGEWTREELADAGLQAAVTEAERRHHEANGILTERQAYADPDDWMPPGEAERLPQWVEDQIPEECPECGLSQLGALTIRRTPAPQGDTRHAPELRRMFDELQGPGWGQELPPWRPITVTLRFGFPHEPGARLAKTMQDHAGRWPPQRKERNQ